MHRSMQMKRRGREKSHGPRQNVLRGAEGVRHRCVPHADHISCKFSTLALSSASSCAKVGRCRGRPPPNPSSRRSLPLGFARTCRECTSSKLARANYGREKGYFFHRAVDARNTEIFSPRKRKRNFHRCTRPSVRPPALLFLFTDRDLI